MQGLAVLCCLAAWPLNEVVDPETEARAAVAFLEQVDECDRIYLRLLSTYAVPPRERAEFGQLQRLAFRQLTLSPNRRVFPAAVPGSATLWWVDLRSWRWNDAAWRAVALRDKAFREPWVRPQTARRLRGLIGERQPANFHAVAVIDAWAFYRRTYQTTETPDYYDLLFAEQRYPAEGTETRSVLKLWPGGTWTDGKDYPRGWYPYHVEFPKRRFADFPQTQDEWLGALLGGIKADDYASALRSLKARRGAVCKGAEDVRKDGSFVARNNRLAMVAPALSGIGRVWGETFDVRKTAGKRDLEENAFTDQARDKGRVFRDGGELLFSLPAGDGLATLLVNAKDQRVEEVPPDIAIHTRDPRDRRVRNGAMACYACHADAYGWIPLANVIERTTPDEIDAKFKDPKTGKKDREAAEDYDAFFLGWQDDLKGARESVKGCWAQATGTRALDFKDGWTGAKLAAVSLKWKWGYDDALTIEQMARETGAPEAILRVAASRSTLRRAADVARQDLVPRATWDEDVFPELMRLLHSKNELERFKTK